MHLRTDSCETPPGLKFLSFIEGVRALVGEATEGKSAGPGVATLLQSYLLEEDLLTAGQLEPDPSKYRRHVLHVEPDGSFSVAALVWLPGQETSVHDHVAWCVVGVYRGAEYETRYELRGGKDDAYLVQAGRRVNQCGSVEALIPPGDIHKVANEGTGLAVSLHIYGADLRSLGSSIRRTYLLPIRTAR